MWTQRPDDFIRHLIGQDLAQGCIKLDTEGLSLMLATVLGTSSFNQNAPIFTLCKQNIPTLKNYRDLPTTNQRIIHSFFRAAAVRDHAVIFFRLFRESYGVYIHIYSPKIAVLDRKCLRYFWTEAPISYGYARSGRAQNSPSSLNICVRKLKQTQSSPKVRLRDNIAESWPI